MCLLADNLPNADQGGLAFASGHVPDVIMIHGTNLGDKVRVCQGAINAVHLQTPVDSTATLAQRVEFVIDVLKHHIEYDTDGMTEMKRERRMNTQWEFINLARIGEAGHLEGEDMDEVELIERITAAVLARIPEMEDRFSICRNDEARVCQSCWVRVGHMTDEWVLL
jgi:hypothetical protein